MVVLAVVASKDQVEPMSETVEEMAVKVVQVQLDQEDKAVVVEPGDTQEMAARQLQLDQAVVVGVAVMSQALTPAVLVAVVVSDY